MLITNDNGIHYFKTNEPADHRARIGGGLMTGANHPTNGLGMRSPLENMSSRRSCIAFLFLHSSFLSWVNRCINQIYHTQKSKRKIQISHVTCTPAHQKSCIAFIFSIHPTISSHMGQQTHKTFGTHNVTKGVFLKNGSRVVIQLVIRYWRLVNSEL